MFEQERSLVCMRRRTAEMDLSIRGCLIGRTMDRDRC